MPNLPPSLLPRRRALLGGVAALAAPVARAQEAYPARPVRLLVPFAPGGGVDVVGRIMAATLAGALHQHFIVENRPGGGGLLALRQAAESPADGYTLAVGAPGPLTIAPTLFAGQGEPFDPLAALEPILFFARTPGIVIGRPNMPADDFAGFLTLSRQAMQRGRPMTMASAGTGSVLHLIGEYLQDLLGLQWLHVPYRGSGPAFTDLAAGTVDLMVDVVPTAAPLVQGGRAKAFAVTMPSRAAQLPTVPTMGELGYGALDMGSWMALVAPAGTPAPIVATLNRSLNAVLAEPSFRERLLASGSEPGGGTPADLRARLERETALWAGIIRAKGVKPN